MIVIAVIGILAGMLVPAIQRSREGSRRARCQNNLHQIGLAMEMYADLQDGRLPHYHNGHDWNSSLGRLYPEYIPDPKAFRCPSDAATPVPTTIDLQLKGDDVRGPNGVMMSYDSWRFSWQLVNDPGGNILSGKRLTSGAGLVFDWYGGLGPGEGTPDQRALNNHGFAGGNVLSFGARVRWVTARDWGANPRTPAAQ